MAKKAKGNRVQVILECTEMKDSGMPGTSRYITTKNIYRIPAVLSGYLIIILVDSSHDIELDQACSLHFLIIKTALGSIYKIGYENSPGSVFSGKLTLNLF